MTYCLGIKVRDGLIGLADGRITSGTQLTSARKVTLHGPNGSQFFIMTSGLRSLRDKAIAYLERDRRAAAVPYATMLDAVGAYTQCLRRVIDEDRTALEHSHIAFNLHAIIGGQLAGDEEPTMFLVYPECNWIQVDERTPYLSIGVTGYGKPILDRALHYDTPLRTALKLAYLSFELDAAVVVGCRLPARSRHLPCQRPPLARPPVRRLRPARAGAVVERASDPARQRHARRRLAGRAARLTGSLPTPCAAQQYR